MESSQTHAGISQTEGCLFSALIGQRRKWVAYLISRGCKPEDAEDVLQNAYLKAYRFQRQLTERQAVESWFYEVLRTAFLDHVRKEAATRKREEAYATESTTQRETETGEETIATCGCMIKRLSRLNPRYADLLEKIDLKGMRPAEYASANKEEVTTTYVAIRRARQALHNELVSFCGSCAKEESCLACECE